MRRMPLAAPSHVWPPLIAAPPASLPPLPLQIGAKMLAANRSYRVRLSYLPAQREQLEAAGRVRSLGGGRGAVGAVC